MKKIFVYFLVLFIKTLMIKSKPPTEPQSIKLNIMESCKEYPSAPIKIRNVLLNNVGGNKVAISGTTIVSEKVPPPLKMSIDIGRCSTKDSECKHNFHPVIDDYCEAIEDPESHPAKFLQLWGLNSSCPILPGNYTFTPQEFKTEFLESLYSLLGNFWKTTILLSDTEDNIKFCIYAEAEMATREQRRKFKFNASTRMPPV